MDEMAESVDNSMQTNLDVKPSMNIKAVFFAIMTVFVAIIMFGSVNTILREIPTQDIYSVVIDAGSTGSRVSVYHFTTKSSADSRVILEEEVFQSCEPGISFYAQNPQKAVKTLQPLLHRAIESVPSQYQPSTLITFKATAGLRLLPRDKADKIISSVRELLQSSPFYIPDSSNIEIMSGEDEGLFGWISVNFLLDLLRNPKHESTVSTFDLGGGSVQVAFEILETSALADTLVRDVIKIVLMQSEFSVLTKSYLGYGLKSARLGIMGGREGPDGVVIYDTHVSHKIDTSVLLLSPCYPAGTNLTFVHNDVSYIVKGQNEAQYVLPLCSKAVDKFVQAADFIQNPQMSQRDIHLFSYFFDVARWAGLIAWNEHLRILTPNDFYNAAAKYCHENHFSQKYPFLCIDLLYIYSLLTVGAGLSADTKLSVENKMLGREVSWTLGAALCTVSDKFSCSTIL